MPTDPQDPVARLPAAGPCEPADGAHGDAALTPLAILEALLFVGNPRNEPLSPAHAAAVMRGIREDEIPQLVAELNDRYARRHAPCHVVQRGQGYCLELRQPYQPLALQVQGRLRRARLSQAAIDVLALVAYRQPLTTEEVDRVRGHPSSHILLQLVRRDLLRIERTNEKPRRARYYTTQRFLELMELESLDDLPRGQEPGLTERM